MSESELVGTWQLVRTAAHASDGTPVLPPYGNESAMGIVSLAADGRMICVLCDSRAEMPDGLEREYNSYCGAYTYDGRQLVTRVDASANDDWFASEQVRDVSFEGDLLVLRPPPRITNGKTLQRVLYWQKID